ncbi:IS91 family transposase [Amedibacillus sp. YH-ame6]
MGHSLFACPACDNFTFVWHTCRSRFCNKCGIKYQKIRSASILNKVFDVSHRHGVFTVPDPLCSFFLENRNLLNLLFDSVNDTISYAIHKLSDKNDDLIPCAVPTLHTFGRSLNWIPHIHSLIAEGELRKDGPFKALKHTNYETLRKSFQKYLHNRLDAHFGSFDFKCIKRQMYIDCPDGFYAYFPPSKHKSLKDCVDYVIRYVGRLVRAFSCIDDYDFGINHVLWHYTDHATKHRVDVFEDTLSLIKNLSFTFLTSILK